MNTYSPKQQRANTVASKQALIGTLAALPAHVQSVVRAYGAACARAAVDDAPAGVPDAAVEVKQVGPFAGCMVRVGDWAISKGVGCTRIVDERFAYGWNECREAMLERLAAAAPEGDGGAEKAECQGCLGAGYVVDNLTGNSEECLECGCTGLVDPRPTQPAAGE